MEPAFINKWLHLLSMIGVLGGIMFGLLVLVPALKDAGEEVSRPLWKRFGISLAILWVVVLATGIYNMILVNKTVTVEYSKLLGMKMGLAMLMFILSMLFAHPMPAMQKLVKNRGPWLLVLLLCGVVVVGISAHLNMSRVSGAGLRAKAVNAP
jgi:putative copper export protein